MRRRALLRTAGAAGALGLAGCLNGEEPEPDPGDEVDPDPEDDADTDPGPEDEGEVEGDEDFDVEGDEDFELPTDPSDDVFVDMTGEDVVEVETIQRDADPEFVFDPPFVRVDRGTTVRWVNEDGVFHTVTSTDDGLESRSRSGDFDETISSVGDTFEWTAEETGRQHYYCSPHVGFMYGVVDVV